MTIDGEAVIYVPDNGAGFDSKHVGKLFGEFRFTLLKNLKAPESGWRLFNALSASTEAEFGPRQRARKALLFISL